MRLSEYTHTTHANYKKSNYKDTSDIINYRKSRQKYLQAQRHTASQQT